MSTEAEAPSGDYGSGAVCPDDLAGAVERCGRILIYGLGRWRGQARSCIFSRSGTEPVRRSFKSSWEFSPGP